ncbi:MAG: hypothetical protein AAF394_00555 [Planctomycetota bacterium]
MNRESILQCIQQELAADLAENGQPSPIGEMVPRVATLIRGGIGSSEFQGVLPVWQVAAFVDGGLDDEQAEKVCKAIQGDNSLLAEIIASVRASQMQPSEPLSPALTASLTAMFAGKDSEARATPAGGAISTLADPALEQQPGSDQLVNEEQTRLAPKPEETAARESRVWIPFMVAAVVILAVGIIGFQVWQGQNQTVVENAPDGEKNRIETPELARDDPDSTEDSLSPNSPSALVEEENSQPESSVPQTAPPPETAIVENNPDSAPDTAPDRPQPETVRVPSGSAVKPSTLIAGLNWSQIDGFLTRRANTETNSIPDSASTRSANWQRIKVDSPVWTDDDFGAITVRTLPQSRAQAIFSPANAEPTEAPANPARLVLGPDSGVKLSSSLLAPEVSQLELEYGSVALMDLNKTSRIELRALGRTVSMLRVDAGSSLVVDYTKEGMRVQVSQGSLAIRGQTFSAESFAIARNGQLVPLDHSRTLPRWINSSQGMLPARVKDMIGDEQDIMQAIARKFASLDAPVSKRDQPVYAALARLQVSLAGSQFLRLASSKRPFLRIAAWNRLVSLQEWDPRYRATWQTLEQMAPNKRIAINFRDLARRVRSKEQYQRTQVEMLLNALESNNSSMRSVAHLFLWQAYPKGPAFDPNWPTVSRNRSVSAWRSNLGSRP